MLCDSQGRNCCARISSGQPRQLDAALAGSASVLAGDIDVEPSLGELGTCVEGPNGL